MTNKDAERFDRLESKIDRLLIEIVPSIKTDVAVIKTEAKQTAKTTSLIIAGIGSAVTLLASIAAAYLTK